MTRFVLLLLIGTAQGAVVNWSDTRAFEHPAPLDVAAPAEASSPQWYVNYSSGSGTACTQVAPCASINAVAGKTGTSGGPAYIYVKGNGYLNITATTLFGGVGTEIVVKPWPGDSTPTVWTAQGGCSRGAANTVNGAGFHDVIFDGGPDMLLRFRGSGCTTDQNGYTLVTCSNNLTFYRVRIDVNNSAGPGLGSATGSGCNQQNFKWINSEITNAGIYYGVYIGGGTGCAAGDTQFTNQQFLNSYFKNLDGRGIQVEPRANSSGFTATGNYFEHIGYNVSGASGGVSAAIQPAASCGGVTASVLIASNVMTDLGGGCVRVDYSGVGGANGFKIIGNTCYDYAKSSSPANTSSHGIGSGTAGNQALVQSNILIKNNATSQGVCAIDCSRSAGFTTAKNICLSTDGGCGSTSVFTTVAALFASTSPTSILFLTLNSTSAAIDVATATSDAPIDYTGKSRTIGLGRDIGAFEYGTGSTASRPKPPVAN